MSGLAIMMMYVACDLIGTDDETTVEEYEDTGLSDQIAVLSDMIVSLEERISDCEAYDQRISSLEEQIELIDSNQSEQLSRIDELEQSIATSDIAVVAFHVGPSADQTITGNGSLDKITSLSVRSGTGDTDTEGAWSTSNDEYVVPYSGMWYLSASCGLNNLGQGYWVTVRFSAGSTTLSSGWGHSSSTQDTVARASATTYLNKGDKLTVYCSHNGSTNQFKIANGDKITYFEGFFLGY